MKPSKIPNTDLAVLFPVHVLRIKEKSHPIIFTFNGSSCPKFNSAASHKNRDQSQIITRKNNVQKINDLIFKMVVNGNLEIIVFGE